MKEVIIIGASGHGKVIADIILKSGDRVVGFLDDDTSLPEVLAGIPVLGTIAEIDRYTDKYFVIGIGNNAIRKRIAEQYDVQWYTAIHPSAAIAMDTEIGAGTVVMANAVVNTSAHIGRHCIINTGAIVEHDDVLEDYVHVSPNATLCGAVTIGESTHIGASATVRNNIRICSGVVVGAGAAVVHNIDKTGTYVGVPAGELM